MKKRVWPLILVLIYMAMLVTMLAIHIQQITGNMERCMATMELILLLLPMLVVTVSYVRLCREREQASEEGCDESDKPQQVQTYEQFAIKIAEDGLSEREKEVAWLIYRGFTNRQIAEELFIAETTVKKHVTHIFEKSKVSGRKELKERWRKEKES